MKMLNLKLKFYANCEFEKNELPISILYRFRVVILIYRKLPILTYPTYIWHHVGSITPFEFRQDLWLQKTTGCGKIK